MKLAGRGFAVVADEVSHLSNKSIESVKKTTEIVESIVKSIASASGMLADTARHLNEILTGIKSVSEISSQTAELNQQQAGAIGQIRQSLDSINLVTQETATNSEETSATVSALSQQISDLSLVVDRMKLANDDTENQKLEALLAEVKNGEGGAPKKSPVPVGAR